jgi:hypothetical protein
VQESRKKRAKTFNPESLMKHAIALALCMVVLGLTRSTTAAPPDLSDIVRFAAPTNFFRHIPEGPPRSDQGDDPFSMDGREFFYYQDKNDRYGQIIFKFGAVGAFVGQGKAVKFTTVTPATLKKQFEYAYRGNFSDAASIISSEIDGLPFVGLSAVRTAQPNYWHWCWVQVDTNTVLKITVVSGDKETFKGVTNSLSSLTIDQPKLRALIRAEQMEITASHLQKVEFGHMNWQGRRTLAFMLHCKDKSFSFAAEEKGTPGETLKIATNWFAKLSDASSQSNPFRMVVIDLGRFPNGPEGIQRTCSFALEERPDAMTRIERADFRLPPALEIAEFWDNTQPDGFEKIGEYQMNADLIIRRKGL